MSARPCSWPSSPRPGCAGCHGPCRVSGQRREVDTDEKAPAPGADWADTSPSEIPETDTMVRPRSYGETENNLLS